MMNTDVEITLINRRLELLEKGLQSLKGKVERSGKDRREYFREYYNKHVKPCADKMEKRREHMRLRRSQQ